MKFFCWFIVFVGFNIAANAQNISPPQNEVVFHEMRMYNVLQNTPSETKISDYIADNYPFTNTNGHSVYLQHHTKSITGNHYTFGLKKDGIDVFEAQIRIHTDKEGNIILIQENLVQVDKSSSAKIGDEKLYWVEIADGWQVAQMVDAKDQYGTKYLKVDNRIVYTYQTKHFLQKPDTQVHAKVFLVNPLTTAHRIYGTPYIDSNDLDVPEINNQRQWVNFKTTFENDTFWLKNERYFFGNVSDPKTPQTYSLSDSFVFNRSQYQFEDVNAFFHITTLSQYVENLGFETILPDTLKIDVHAYNGDDLSSFNYEVEPLELEMGEGGVDDAEDGEVITHEFGHALIYMAGPTTYTDTRDRDAMEEGNADYICVSYSRSYDDYGWKEIFDWDGHNEFWSGIHTGDVLIYPQQMTNSSNENREMWSTPLICLYEKLGRETCDSLFFEHLFYQAKNATIPQMAEVILMVDSLIWEGKYNNEIRKCFGANKILAVEPNVVLIDLFLISNSLGFSNGSADLTITSKQNQVFNVRVTSILGQTMEEYEQINSLTLNPYNFTPGVYFVQLNLGNFTASFKLVKT
ncbi:MAG: T9SS type A sorting domain-containing protein [Flavobacteriales bacterium]|nr:T9SS type A sorting domain-containing protein [Flavobacteriales bacterium]